MNPNKVNPCFIIRERCRSQYEHPGSAIGYWTERCLGHVYIVLEPVGSTRLTFDEDIILYELCDLVTEFYSESQMRSWTRQRVSKWSRVKYWCIGRWYSDIESVSGGTGYLSGHRKGFRAPPAKDMGLMCQEGKRTSHKGLVRPPYGLN